MGFLSNMKNNLTGSWANVNVRTAPQLRRGEPASVAVDVQVKDNDITVNGVVVELSLQERVSLNGVDLMGDGDNERVDGQAIERLHHQEFTIAAGQHLGANQAGSFEGQVQLPTHLPPSARGRNAEFRWQVRARLDMKGNDPDSGWQVVEVH